MQQPSGTTEKQVHAEQAFTVAEVARAVRVSPRTVRNWISSGQLGAVVIGGSVRKQYRIPEDAIRRWVAEREVSVS